MAINYSKRLILSVPGDTESKKQVVAQAQAAGEYDLEAFAEHIAEHGSVYDESIIQGVLTKAVSCMRELLLQGNRIKLGLLSTFYVTLKSNATDLWEAFTASATVTSCTML